jgi:hypothetical protein
MIHCFSVSTTSVSSKSTTGRGKGNLKVVSGLASKYVPGAMYCTQIAMLNGMVPVRVSGDGNCQYYSIIECLKSVKYPERLTVSSLRQTVYSTISSDKSHYAQYVTDVRMDMYLQGVLQRAWGDQLTVRAIADSLNVFITVYQFNCLGQSITHYGDNLSAFHIFLTLDNRNESTAHYCGLISLPATEPARKTSGLMSGSGQSQPSKSFV